ncbi:MAG: PilZ domain-containing protein, partial [Thermodesulfobacteriota bacterium]
RVTRNLNENGITLVSFAPLPIGETLSLSLHLGPKVLHCDGTVLYLNKTQSRGQMFTYGVKFDRISRAEMDQIRQFCFNAMVPAFLQRFERKQSFVMKVASWYYDQNPNRRQTGRRVINLPLIIRTDTSVYGVTNDISVKGLSFASHVPFETGKRMRMEIPTPFGTIHTEGEIRNCREIASQRLYFLGVQFTSRSDETRDIVSLVTLHYRQRSVA